ncbi:MAG TPA: hypothetical protein VFH78_00885 [Candidatus Thermoplasmatota archaeon]|nr:hypothetical protein [Candidatus Thermoplasmatota archaeon]
MRALLLALLLAPAALGQPEVVDWVTLEIEPFPEHVEPLREPVVTRFVARASCLLSDASSGGQVTIMYLVAEAPAWSAVTVSPATDVKSVQACENGYVRFEGVVQAIATDQAPGFVAAPIVLEAVVGAPGRQETERASVDLTASYFGVLDVQLDHALASVPAGRTHEFPVTLVNFGNAPTRVDARLTHVDDGLRVEPPERVALASRQHGSQQTSAVVAFRVTPVEGSAFTNRALTFSAAIESYYALDDSFRGTSSTLSFLVTVLGGAASAAQKLPIPGAPALALVGALAFVAAAARRPLRP